MLEPKRRLVVLDPPARACAAAPRREDDDHFHDECGVFGVFGHSEAANMTYLGLHALQHRGQESAGIVTSDGGQLYAHRAMGLVTDAFSQEQLGKLPGRQAIGHVRYSTAGASHVKNAQPFAVDYARGVAAENQNSLVEGEDSHGRVILRQIFSTDAAGVVCVRSLR